tara:strand:+ start:32 stop:472 length:441 start_codon:yes stop_codon:yes gene_type:complete
MKIFDWVNELLVGKRPWDSFSEADQKTFNPFIINRFLSMDKDFIEIVNFFQKYSIGTLEPREVYKWYCDILPKGKRFNKYIKGKNKKDYAPWVTELLSKHFHCSKEHAEEYLELISEEELKDIFKIYASEPSKVKKFLKQVKRLFK